MNRNQSIRAMTSTAVLIAVLFMMKLSGLGSVPVGPLYMSFLTLPIALGAMLIGPGAGAVLGAVFGGISFYDALTGRSVMTGIFFQTSPIHTFLLCVGTRMLMGYLAGLLARRLLRRGHQPWRYLLGALLPPVLNTLLFMGYIVLFFYGTPYVQGLVEKLGAANPLAFVVLLVGMQGVIEAVSVCLVGAALTKAVSKVTDPFLK